jgi:hypothetical protein
MADPRAFTIVCPKNEGGNTANKRSFFNAVGKIGDIQALNDLGASKIGAGLRTLNSVSNSIRGGCGSIPNSIANSIDAGANWVLSNVGIAPSVVDAVAKFQPGIANQAYGQAKQLFQQVQQGNFKLKDIPGYAQDFQNLAGLGSRIFTPTTPANKSIEICEGTSPYAIDLLVRAPKYKFLYVVQFIMNDPYGSLDNVDLAFGIKTITRPSLKVQMEDVNYYNFRSKAITRTEFEEMKMTFHEDTGFGKGSVDGAVERGNNAVRFFNTYMRATVPITNHSDAEQLSNIKQEGMKFNQNFEIMEGTILAGRYGASYGPLEKTATGQDPTNIIREIKVFHVYDHGHHMNVYKFFNPRITAMSMDDLDMSASTEGCEVTMSFNYDSVYIDTGVSMADFNLAGIQPNALYPLRYNKSSDGKPATSRNIKPFGEPSSVPDKCSPSINTSSP